MTAGSALTADSAALGINARSSARGEGGSEQLGRAPVAQRSIRYELLDAVRRLMYAPGRPADDQERVCSCHYRRKAMTVDVRLDRRRGRAHYGGVETCRSVWLCPVCSASITEQRREELQRAINTWVKDHGGEVYLVTLTFPHQRPDRLAELVKGLRRALKRFNAMPAMKRARSATGHAGSIRALEVTWGSWHGWHPHIHTLWFGKPGQLEELRRLAPAWVDCLVRAELADRAQLNDMLSGAAGESPAFDVQNGDYAADYIAKFGNEPSLLSKIEAGATWGAARELVSGQAKTGRRLRGVTPFTLLAIIAGRSELRGLTPGRAIALFSEYALAFKNERQLYWSPRLRAALNMGKLFTDEELAELADQAPDVSTVCSLTADDWRLVIAHKARAAVLHEAELAGAAGVAALLAELRARPGRQAPPYPKLDAPRERWPARGFALYQTPDGATHQYWGIAA
jgi:replication protein